VLHQRSQDAEQRVGTCSTTLLDPKPITGNISPVLGIARCGIPCWASASSAVPPAMLAATAAAVDRAMNWRRVVVC
jgi:hypothetical protein